MKTVQRLMWLALLLLVPISSWASSFSIPNDGWCSGTSTQQVYRIAGFNPPPLDVNVPIGAVMYQSPTLTATDSNGGGFSVSCGVGYKFIQYWYTGPYGLLYPADSIAYSTNIPGLGVRLVINGQTVPYYNQTPTGSPSLYFYNSLGISIALVKTGDIAPGGVLGGEIGGISVFGGSPGNVAISFQLGDGGTPIPVEGNPTCSAVSPQAVPMGTVSVKDFSTPGQPAARSTPFNITLTCSGGSAGTTSEVLVTLTDQANPGNTSNILPLTAGAASASGVGIQVLHNGNVLNFGPDSGTVGNPGQWSAGSTGNGQFVIPMTARYIQTTSDIQPGNANGIATFTLSYQ